MIDLQCRTIDGLPHTLSRCSRCKPGRLEWQGYPRGWICSNEKCRQGIALSGIFDHPDAEDLLIRGVHPSCLPLADYALYLIAHRLISFSWITASEAMLRIKQKGDIRLLEDFAAIAEPASMQHWKWRRDKEIDREGATDRLMRQTPRRWD